MANEFIVRKGLIVEGASGGTVVDIQGSQGQLFSVTDDLSGSIFAVSDISGVPIFDVNSSGVSYFDGNVGIGTTTPGRKLEVVSSAGIVGVLTSTTGGSYITMEDSATTSDTQVRYGAIGNNAALWAGGSQRMAISSDGNVGIGTTSNSAEDTNNGVPKLQVTTTTAVLGEFPLAARFTTASDAGDDSGVSVLINSGNDRGLMISAGRQTGNVSKVTLNVVKNDGDEIDTITMLQNGQSGSTANVGIGTTSPDAKLEISDATNDNLRIGTRGGNMNLFSVTDAGAGSPLAFEGSQFNFITGNVGIGTTAPGTKLDVDGAITAGAANSTDGSVLMYGKYSNGHLATIGTEYSNGGLVLGYGVTPSTTAAGGFVSSSAATNLTRGAYSFAAGTHKWWSDPVSTTIAVGTTSPLNNTMTLLDTGNLGIGTTAPDWALDVEAVSTSVQFQLGRTGTSVGSTWMGSDSNGFRIGVGTYGAGNNIASPNGFTVTTTGNVGIGTTGPATKLQVVGATGEVVRISAADTTTGAINTGAYISIGGHDGVNPRTFGYVGAFKENGTSGNYSGYLALATRVNGGSSTEKLRITSAGDVLVGKTAVGVGTDGVELRANGLLSASRTGTSSNNVAYFNRNPDGGGNYGDGAVIQLRKNNVVVGVLGTEKWGIGTASPSKALHVVGDIQVTNAFYDSTVSAGTSGQVLSSTATGTAWVAAGGGGGSTVYTAAIWEVESDTFSTDDTTIICDTNRIYNGSTSVSTAGATAGSLVIDDAGVYEISYSVSVKATSSITTRQVPALYLTLTPNGGTEVKIPGSINATYLRLPGANQGGFTSFSNKIYVEVAAEAEIQLKIVWLNGSTKSAQIYTAAGIQNTISIRRINAAS